ncbi:MAG TPA: aldo/keto reductase [Candidatus Binatia bacterium]|nr:aldo/keto reductase [Candidatus Binatia bacterium]
MSASIATRALGRRGLVVSRLGLGLAALGRPGYITLGRDRDLPAERTREAMYARTAEVLDAAWAAGVRYVDVARSYGEAEVFLARWIAAQAVPPADLTVGSKWGYRYTAGWRVDAPVHEEKEHSLARFTTQLAESRRLLGPWLDVYQVHSATLESGLLDDPALLRALTDARRRGAYRAVGLTLSGPGSAATLARALEACVDGEPVFDAVQATFNCLEPSLAGPLAAAHAAGLGVIAKEVLANGRLAAANPRPEDRPLVERLGALAAARGAGVDQLALAFVLAHPFVDVALSGAATTAQLASHVGAFAVALDDATLAALGALAEPVDRYWQTRSALPWT